MFNRPTNPLSVSVSFVVEGSDSYFCVRFGETSTYFRGSLGSSVNASVTNNINAEGKVVPCEVIVMDGKKVTGEDSRKISHIDPSVKIKLDLAIDNLKIGHVDEAKPSNLALK